MWGSRVGRRTGLMVLVAAAVVVSACGSSSEESAPTPSPKPAGAQENAVASGAVCYSWPNGTTDAQPCAVGLKGPGGGRVFYDAGSVQPWGRFLEVAPQAWGGKLVLCDSCGAAAGVTTETSDGAADSGYPGYKVCTITLDFTGAAGKAIGDGRRNTEALAQRTECTNPPTAVTLATGYRGLGLTDWYLPSQDELVELCKYEGRNAIGGFLAKQYVSSTGVDSDPTRFVDVNFGDAPGCTQGVAYSEKDGSKFYLRRYVRPIRAFS
jgi:hypothetical protein